MTPVLRLKDKNSSAMAAFCGLRGALVLCARTTVPTLCGLAAGVAAAFMSPLISGGVIVIAAAMIKNARMPDVGWRVDPFTCSQLVTSGTPTRPHDLLLAGVADRTNCVSRSKTWEKYPQAE